MERDQTEQIVPICNVYGSEKGEQSIFAISRTLSVYGKDVQTNEDPASFFGRKAS